VNRERHHQGCGGQPGAVPVVCRVARVDRVRFRAVLEVRPHRAAARSGEDEQGEREGVKKMSELRNVILQGDVLAMLATIPDKKIKCAITSPPYWPSLRDYEIATSIWGGDKNCQHEWQALPPVKRTSPGDIPTEGSIQSKRPNDIVNRPVQGSEWCARCEAWKGQFGHEPTGQLYLVHSMMVIDEIWRVLADDGSMWWNVGDAHAGSGGAGGNWNEGKRAGATKWRPRVVKANPHINHEPGKVTKDVKHVDGEYITYIRDRSLFGTPGRLEAAIIDAGWIVPNVIIWHKKAAFPFSGTRRFTIDYETFIWAVKNPDYYFVQQKEPRTTAIKHKKSSYGGVKKSNGNTKEAYSNDTYRGEAILNDDDDRNMRSVWQINTAKCKSNHFASFPQELVRIPIRACTRRGDVVFDPFNGTGTTCAEAKRQGRDYIGIEINPEYVKIAEKRIERQKVSKVEITTKKSLEAFIS
jgi:DNA modification methylase